MTINCGSGKSAPSAQAHRTLFTDCAGDPSHVEGYFEHNVTPFLEGGSAEEGALYQMIMVEHVGHVQGWFYGVPVSERKRVATPDIENPRRRCVRLLIEIEQPRLERDVGIPVRQSRTIRCGKIQKIHGRLKIQSCNHREALIVVGVERIGGTVRRKKSAC
jgi:hypothetical protein